MRLSRYENERAVEARVPVLNGHKVLQITYDRGHARNNENMNIQNSLFSKVDVLVQITMYGNNAS